MEDFMRDDSGDWYDDLREIREAEWEAEEEAARFAEWMANMEEYFSEVENQQGAI